VTRTEYAQRLPDGATDDTILPCGHSVKQGRFLDCDLDGCRKTDVKITEQYKRSKED
jgi:hypothetical protein